MASEQARVAVLERCERSQDFGCEVGELVAVAQMVGGIPRSAAQELVREMRASGEVADNGEKGRSLRIRAKRWNDDTKNRVRLAQSVVDALVGIGAHARRSGYGVTLSSEAVLALARHFGLEVPELLERER